MLLSFLLFRLLRDQGLSFGYILGKKNSSFLLLLYSLRLAVGFLLLAITIRKWVDSVGDHRHREEASFLLPSLTLDGLWRLSLFLLQLL